MDGRWDVVIVGAGPAGLAAGIYAGRARRSTLILERAVPGGQILLTDWVENYPGFPDGLSGFDLMQSFRRHAEKFGAKIDSDEVRSIARAGDVWRLQGHHQSYDARAVIVATGSSYRRLDLADEARLTGRGVSYCATCDGAFFSGLDVAVVGGGDNAMKESMFLTKYAGSVTIIHRRDRFRGEKVYQERVLANPKIKVLWETVIEAIRGADKVDGLSLKNLKTGAVSALDIQGLFVSIGTEPKAEFLRGLVDLNEWGQVKVNLDQGSSVPGIFAAGDVSDACPKQIATAVGTGVHAALSVEEYLSKR